MKTQVMEDKPDFKPASIRYNFNNLDANPIDIFIEGAEHVWNSHVLPLQSELSSAQEKNRKLLEALKDTVERMGRARGILTNMYGVHDSWQMLNAERYQELISEIENKKI